jgi:high affinity Mn2+ porin
MKGAACAILVVAAACPVSAQGPDAVAPVDGPTTIFDAHGTDRFWISGQANFIYQAHPEFPSPYSGPHSLRAETEHALSRLLTLFTGVKVAGGTEILLHIESAGGRGIRRCTGCGWVHQPRRRQEL